MKTEHPKIPKSSSWLKTVVKKWLNMTNGEFHSDCTKMLGIEERRKSCSGKDGSLPMRRDLSGGWLVESSENLIPLKYDSSLPPITSSIPLKSLRVFVGTWNVGGRAPHEGLNLSDWLLNTSSSSSSPADLYVLGFQEIIPLNLKNVLGVEDKGPAYRWLHLIRQALNSSTPPLCTPKVPSNNTSVTDKPRVSFSDLLAMESENDSVRWSTSTSTSCNSSDEELLNLVIRAGKYMLVASKQMVGVFLCVWVREDLISHVTSLKVSCVGTGIMGYMGNKGSISISMTVQRTTFCFVCTHLASGEKDGDEVRRNSDVIEILKRTKFLQSHRFSHQDALSPETISEHDKIIWLGDLNYRLTANCNDARNLLEKNDWQSLFEKDQLRVQLKAGRVFDGWEEGTIYFPPTYKYVEDSDNYVGNSGKSKEKRRTPAWCDRILWRGTGIKQMWYMRGESRFSDHRPVYSLFFVQLDYCETDQYQTSHMIKASENIPETQNMSININSCSDVSAVATRTTYAPQKNVNNSSSSKINGDNSSLTKVQLEEMLVLERTQSCLQLLRF